MSTTTEARARVAALARHRPDDLPALNAARTTLKFSRAEQYVRELVEGAPPLTEAQRDRLALLLRPGAA